MVKRLYKESLLKQEFVFIIAILLLNSCINLENWQRGVPMQFKYKDGSRPSEHCIPYISFVYEVDKCKADQYHSSTNYKTPTDKTWLTDRVGRTFYKPEDE